MTTGTNNGRGWLSTSQDNEGVLSDQSFQKQPQIEYQTKIPINLIVNSQEQKVINETTIENESEDGLRKIPSQQMSIRSSARSPMKQYEETTKNLRTFIKSKNYWPPLLKRPQEFRAFYWSPDYSFCGFATEESIKKSAKQWQKEDSK